MIWLLFVSSAFGPEVVLHRIPLPTLAICKAVAAQVTKDFIALGQDVEIVPGVWVMPRMSAFPKPICRAEP